MTPISRVHQTISNFRFLATIGAAESKHKWQERVKMWYEMRKMLFPLFYIFLPVELLPSQLFQQYNISHETSTVECSSSCAAINGTRRLLQHFPPSFTHFSIFVQYVRKLSSNKSKINTKFTVTSGTLSIVPKKEIFLPSTLTNYSIRKRLKLIQKSHLLFKLIQSPFECFSLNTSSS